MVGLWYVSSLIWLYWTSEGLQVADNGTRGGSRFIISIHIIFETNTSETRDEEDDETPPSNTRGRQTRTHFDYQLDGDEENRDIVLPIRYGYD
jgi:hypothetical protein